MSILIENITMPKTCYDCPFAMSSFITLYHNKPERVYKEYSCVLTHTAITSTKRNKACPLKEVEENEDS